ncbi:hypothetical protein [Aquimarina sediminis]|uniref:hypothetical protein n=1 Tax=Aquimarina sediminis TaxID=2070536 RepID=UPI000CA0572B|nr:hypothetical protein [Aquimarina sediminis]
MKTRKSNSVQISPLVENGCCNSISETKEVTATSCCTQPEDGSSCCDKSMSKEENITNTGCC